LYWRTSRTQAATSLVTACVLDAAEKDVNHQRNTYIPFPAPGLRPTRLMEAAPRQE
jgi:hypothetical protein